MKAIPEHGPTVEEHLAAWAAQSPTCMVSRAEWDFVHQMRRSAGDGVGYGWMQQMIEVEWNAKTPNHGWGPSYFDGRMTEMKLEIERLRTAMRNALCFVNSESDVASILVKALPPSSIAPRPTSVPLPGTSKDST